MKLLRDDAVLGQLDMRMRASLGERGAEKLERHTRFNEPTENNGPRCVDIYIFLLFFDNV